MTQQDMEALFRAGLNSGVGKSVKHESAAKHVSGEALYIDDRPEFPHQLHLVPLLSPHAHANIVQMDIEECYNVTGVVRVITAADIPGNPDIAPLTTGDPLLADGIVEYVGQVILVVAATSQEAAREAIGKVRIDYQPLDAVLNVKQALALEYYVEAPHQHQRGDSAAALNSAPHRLQGELEIGGQEAFLSGNPDRLGDAGRRRRDAGLQLDAASDRSAETGGVGAGFTDAQSGGGHAPHGRWFWRQRDTGGGHGLSVGAGRTPDRQTGENAPLKAG